MLAKKTTHVHSLVLLGKQSSKDGSGRKSGALGSTVCFRFLTFSWLEVEGSKVSVALGPEYKVGETSFLLMLPFMSVPWRKELLGNFDQVEQFLLLHTADAKLVCIDAISAIAGMI